MRVSVRVDVRVRVNVRLSVRIDVRVRTEISQEMFLREVKRKIRIFDKQSWFIKLWNDNSSVNGNNLRVIDVLRRTLFLNNTF